MTITEATPSTIPRIVKVERSRCTAMLLSPTRRMWRRAKMRIGVSLGGAAHVVSGSGPTDRLLRARLLLFCRHGSHRCGWRRCRSGCRRRRLFLFLLVFLLVARLGLVGLALLFVGL